VIHKGKVTRAPLRAMCRVQRTMCDLAVRISWKIALSDSGRYTCQPTLYSVPQLVDANVV